MANNNTGSNRSEVPEAREALDRFKMEVASEIGVPLKQGYNGDLTSAQAGSVGGEMVRQMIKRQEEQMKSGGSI
ncbi:MAG: alpha/beta-type small acid-soluble spore protein [Lachnospiraceae bacterium]|nr:alpha/beta-type small acid-soluble spore protein [Lachnospiraceae bacterium]